MMPEQRKNPPTEDDVAAIRRRRRAPATATAAEPAAAVVASRQFPAVGCAVWTLLVLARLVGSATCSATDFHARPGHVDLTELRRNIVQGLKLDRIPDMTKVGAATVYI